MGRAVAGEKIAPFRMLRSAARADAVGEMLVHAVRHQELRILGPAVEPLGVSDLVLAERFAMGFGRVLLVRCAVADMALDNDQRGPARSRVGEVERAAAPPSRHWRRARAARSSHSRESASPRPR